MRRHHKGSVLNIVSVNTDNIRDAILEASAHPGADSTTEVHYAPGLADRKQPRYKSLGRAVGSIALIVKEFGTIRFADRNHWLLRRRVLKRLWLSQFQSGGRFALLCRRQPPNCEPIHHAQTAIGSQAGPRCSQPGVFRNQHEVKAEVKRASGYTCNEPIFLIASGSQGVSCTEMKAAKKRDETQPAESGDRIRK